MKISIHLWPAWRRVEGKWILIPCEINTTSPLLYLIESGQLCFPEVSYWLLMEDSEFLSPLSLWSCARREQKREGEMNNPSRDKGQDWFLTLAKKAGRKLTVTRVGSTWGPNQDATQCATQIPPYLLSDTHKFWSIHRVYYFILINK